MFSTSTITYVSHSGSDKLIVDAARVSYNQDGGSWDATRDTKLIHYLMRNRHTTPFEMADLTVCAHIPLFVARQWMRHRTFSYNEVSRRYTADDMAFFSPETWRVPATTSKQSSIEGDVDDALASRIYREVADHALQAYESLLELGVAREQARMVLPQSMMTRFYAKANLHNWLHFCGLRLHPHAQKEIREVAQSCRDLLATHFPVSVAAWEEYRT